MRYVRGLFSWQVAGPLCAYVFSALFLALIISTIIDKQQAVDSLAQARAAASRRIDILQDHLFALQARLRHVQSSNARERGRLEDAIMALTEQIRQAGGTPVTTGQPSPSPTAHRSPSPQPSHPASRPTPKPSPTHSPSPSPAPTACNLDDLIRDPIDCLHL